jgi:hypothetical protein
MSKDECDFFYYQSRMNHVSRGQNPLKLLYSIMILNTIVLHYKAGPINMIWLLLSVFDWNHNDWSRWFAISSSHLFAVPVSVYWWVANK